MDAKKKTPAKNKSGVGRASIPMERVKETIETLKECGFETVSKHGRCQVLASGAQDFGKAHAAALEKLAGEAVGIRRFAAAVPVLIVTFNDGGTPSPVSADGGTPSPVSAEPKDQPPGTKDQPPSTKDPD